MESILSGPIVYAISIKNRNLEFYRAMAAKVSDNSIRKVFDTLAEEESGHLEAFCDLYQGEETELAAILNRSSIFIDPYYCSLITSIDGASGESDALRIALRQDQSCIEWFAVFADIIRVPHIHAVFAKVLEETTKRGDLIQNEYMRLTVRNPADNRHKTILNTAPLHELSL